MGITITGNAKILADGVDVTALAIPEPEPEPVAWRYLEDPFGANEYLITDDPDTAKGPGWTPLYTHPPQRKPLTEGFIKIIIAAEMCGSGNVASFVDIGRAIERAHGIGEQND